MAKSVPSKDKTRFVCQECGGSFPNAYGRCGACGGWNTLVEEKIVPEAKGAAARFVVEQEGRPRGLAEIDLSQAPRIATGLAEFDRLLGGGIVPGSVTLIGGDPGIGKSTLLLQVAHRLATQGHKPLYISGEESLAQIRMRAQRLGLSSDTALRVGGENRLEAVLELLQQNPPALTVIDSVQTLFTSALESAPGSVAQVRECAARLVSWAKGGSEGGRAVMLVGHVTKEGAIAGPRVLEHMVDTVLYFEGERGLPFRILRGVKNRFGATDEIAVFQMAGEGLAEVVNPSELFLGHRDRPVSGSAVAAMIEGTRPILVEIQALVSPTAFGMPRRTTVGIDSGRLAMLLAVLEKRVGLHLSDQDVFANAVGGLKLTEPASDLAAALAIWSSFRDHPLPDGLVALGEVGLSGEIRPVPLIDQRLREAVKLGFRRAVIPVTGSPESIPGAELIRVHHLAEAVDRLSG